MCVEMGYFLSHVTANNPDNETKAQQDSVR